MKQKNNLKFLFLFLTISLFNCQLQSNKETGELKILKFDLKIKADSIGFQNWKKINLLKSEKVRPDTLFALDTLPVGTLLYSNEDYLVYGYCRGEFGGALIFQDRLNPDSIYYLESVCPTMVERRNCTYFISSSLPHMYGSTNILMLDFPKNLIRVNKDSLSTNWKLKAFPNLNENERYLATRNQGTVIMDTIGMVLNLFYPNNRKNHLIFSASNHTLHGKLEGNKLVVLDTVLNFTLSPNYEELNDINNGFYHFKFGTKSSKVQGDLYCKKDSIIIGLSKSL